METLPGKPVKTVPALISTRLEKLNLQNYEKKMVELKYKSLPFSKMSQKELKTTASLLLLKINLITGWALLDDSQAARIFKEQFEMKLTESYPLVNVDEMEYAFRNNTTVKDWGKYLNLSLVDEVMIPYLEKRAELSRIEEKVSYAELPAPKLKLPDEEFIELNKNTYLKTKNFRFIVARCYDLLVKQKKIVLTEEEKEPYRQRARTIFFSKENEPLLEKGLTHVQQETYINNDAKRLAVADYFEKENVS